MLKARQFGQDGWFVKNLTIGEIFVDFCVVFDTFVFVFNTSWHSCMTLHRVAAGLQNGVILVRCERFSGPPCGAVRNFFDNN